MGRSTIRTVDVRADGTGLSSRAGSALLALVAQRLGLTDGLGAALQSTRERRSAHGLRLNAASVLPADRAMLLRSRARRCPKTAPNGVSQRRRTCPDPDLV